MDLILGLVAWLVSGIFIGWITGRVCASGNGGPR
jgi:hypothetical protein